MAHTACWAALRTLGLGWTDRARMPWYICWRVAEHKDVLSTVESQNVYKESACPLCRFFRPCSVALSAQEDRQAPDEGPGDVGVRLRRGHLRRQQVVEQLGHLGKLVLEQLAGNPLDDHPQQPQDRPLLLQNRTRGATNVMMTIPDQ